MKKLTKRQICLGVALVGIALLLAYELFGRLLTGGMSETLGRLVDMTVTRFIGGIIFTAMLINLGFRVLNPLKRPFWRSLLLCLPPFAVAVNNFPFSQVIRGGAVIDSPWWTIALLALECFCIGFFEETAFRGVVFLGILKKHPSSKKWAFCSILLSSAVFGLIHLINLYHSSPISVIMQIGYSFLIGAMCSVVLMRTANIWLCVILHGLFNFCGAVVPTCGHGEIWDTFTVILTASIAVLVTVYMKFVFFSADSRILDGVFGKKINGKQDNIQKY